MEVIVIYLQEKKKFVQKVMTRVFTGGFHRDINVVICRGIQVHGFGKVYIGVVGFGYFKNNTLVSTIVTCRNVVKTFSLKTGTTKVRSIIRINTQVGRLKNLYLLVREVLTLKSYLIVIVAMTVHVYDSML